MNTLTAANNARAVAAMNRRNIDVAGQYYTVSELMDEGLISYVRTRTFSDGKRTYGFILSEDVLAAHANQSAESLAQALAYTPFHETSKMVADALHAEGISRVAFNTAAEDFTIEYAD